jgi:hypothetical protein
MGPGTLVHKEIPASRGASQESPWSTQSGITTRTGRQGLGLCELKGVAMTTADPWAHLPQPRHRAASQTSAVPGALWGEGQPM